jgi:hypothetical protein
MDGQWLKEGFSLPPQPWTHNRIHCANVVRFNGQYVYVFDGVTDPNAANLHWAMGFATFPIFP